MGFGDEIMAAGAARRAQARDPRPVAVRGRDGRQRWHALWAGNPRLATPAEVAAGRDVQWIENGPGCRPYIDYDAMRRDWDALFPDRAFTTKVRDARLPWRFTAWRAAPGELFLPRAANGGYVVVEPNVKPGASPNKHWGRARWQALVDLLPHVDWVQLGPPGTRPLRGARLIATATFAAGCTALGVPAVVVFGGATSPANLGYSGHINLFDPAEGASPCGQRVPCGHCARALAAFPPDLVAHHLEHVLHHGHAA